MLAFREVRPDTGYDLMTLEVEGDEETGWKPGTPVVFWSTRFDETTPMFSPDGRWLAYVSDELGRPEAPLAQPTFTFVRNAESCNSATPQPERDRSQSERWQPDLRIPERAQT